jgi:hypothetical protein
VWVLVPFSINLYKREKLLSRGLCLISFSTKGIPFFILLYLFRIKIPSALLSNRLFLVIAQFEGHVICVCRGGDKRGGLVLPTLWGLIIICAAIFKSTAQVDPHRLYLTDFSFSFILVPVQFQCYTHTLVVVVLE